jgi:uncharacterized protein with ParB-like and HNH nuclease domain
MKAEETKLHKILEQSSQYVIPLFQRTYSWTNKEWQVLWDDIMDLIEADTPKIHFLGSMVSMRTISPAEPEGITKYLLVDGQQRLATIFIVLIILRDRALQEGNHKLANEIQEKYLVNKFSDGDDFFKFMPSETDKEVFMAYIKETVPQQDGSMVRAFNFFHRKLQDKRLNITNIKKIIISSFSIVNIELHDQDNPYLVFESLNVKGKPLTQADLIRNYFFMRIDIPYQANIHQTYWKPMDMNLGEHLTDFIRHFLMRNGATIKQTDIYYTLKERVTKENAITSLKEIHAYSHFYDKILHPEKETIYEISKYLKRLNRIEVTTAYPLLLICYYHYTYGKITVPEFVETLKTLENYLIRRSICGIPSNQLGKIFPTVVSQVADKEHTQFVEQIKNILLTKNYPKDSELKEAFMEAKMYGGDKGTRTKLILEIIEESFQHKEMVKIDKNYTIEHIMPQTLTESWKVYLGDDWENTHEFYLNNIGNLTLTAYNTELSNGTFAQKCQQLNSSHLELNKYFTPYMMWGREAIEARAADLAEKSIRIWSYFGNANAEDMMKNNIKSSPYKLEILGQTIIVNNWRDVLVATFNEIWSFDPEKFDILLGIYARYLSKDKNFFKSAYRELSNGYFISVNFAIKDSQKLCKQAFIETDLPLESWKPICY